MTLTVSICVSIKNRSRVRVAERVLNLFPKCVDSVRTAATETRVDCELLVADWSSDDLPLQQWLRSRATPIPVQVFEQSGYFRRGAGRNAAAFCSNRNILFFIDADMLICPIVLLRAQNAVISGASYFPICFSFNDPEHRTGFWRTSGYGNCAVSRSNFEKVRWPEYAQWGKEDDHFYQRMCELGPVVREQVPGFYHQWHPNDLAWKDRYVNPKT